MTNHLTDLRQRFIRDYIFPTLKAQARYESEYLLCAALSRPLIAEELVRVANEENCSLIAHGGRGSGLERVKYTIYNYRRKSLGGKHPVKY